VTGAHLCQPTRQRMVCSTFMMHFPGGEGPWWSLTTASVDRHRASAQGQTSRTVQSGAVLIRIVVSDLGFFGWSG
jgi:hypothetical protein